MKVESNVTIISEEERKGDEESQSRSTNEENLDDTEMHVMMFS